MIHYKSCAVAFFLEAVHPTLGNCNICKKKKVCSCFITLQERSALHFSQQHSLFRDSFDGASFEHWTKALEITTCQWCPLYRDGNSAPAVRAQLHPSFTTIYPHNGHFLQMKGQAGPGGGVGGTTTGVGGAVGENRTRGWQRGSVCHFLEWSGRAPLRDRARPVRPTLWMQIVLHCKRLHRSSEGAGSFILWMLWMSGFGFWVKAERRCFRSFLRAEQCAFISAVWKP